MRFVEYHRITGEIVAVGHAPRLDFVQTVSQLHALKEVDQGQGLGTHYVDTATGEIKPLLRLTPVVQGQMIYGLPIGGTLHAYGARHAITASEARLAFNIPGPHRIKITAPKYAETVIVVPDEP